MCFPVCMLSVQTIAARNIVLRLYNIIVTLAFRSEGGVRGEMSHDIFNLHSVLFVLYVYNMRHTCKTHTLLQRMCLKNDTQCVGHIEREFGHSVGFVLKQRVKIHTVLYLSKCSTCVKHIFNICALTQRTLSVRFLWFVR